MSEGIFSNIHGGDLQKVWYKPLDLAKGDYFSSLKIDAYTVRMLACGFTI